MRSRRSSSSRARSPTAPTCATSRPTRTSSTGGKAPDALRPRRATDPPERGRARIVEFHAEESQLLLPRLLAEGRRFDLAFVDGNHRFEGVFLDLIYSARLLAERSVVFVDDVQLPGVRAAVDFCIVNLAWTVEEEGTEDVHSWRALRTGPADAFRRPFDAFVPS